MELSYKIQGQIEQKYTDNKLESVNDLIPNLIT